MGPPGLCDLRPIGFRAGEGVLHPQINRDDIGTVRECDALRALRSREGAGKALASGKIHAPAQLSRVQLASQSWIESPNIGSRAVVERHLCVEAHGLGASHARLSGHIEALADCRQPLLRLARAATFVAQPSGLKELLPFRVQRIGRRKVLTFDIARVLKRFLAGSLSCYRVKSRPRGRGLRIVNGSVHWQQIVFGEIPFIKLDRVSPDCIRIDRRLKAIGCKLQRGPVLLVKLDRVLAFGLGQNRHHRCQVDDVCLIHITRQASPHGFIFLPDQGQDLLLPVGPLQRSVPHLVDHALQLLGIRIDINLLPLVRRIGIARAFEMAHKHVFVLPRQF